MIEAYLLAISAIVIAQISPGPNLIAVASAGLAQGRKSALYNVLGIATGILIWSTAVAFGLSTLLAVYPSILIVMKIIGGTYLLYLGFCALKTLNEPIELKVERHAEKESMLSSWRRGLLINLTNPKAGLSLAGIGTLLFAGGLSSFQVFLFGPIAATTAILIYGSYALMFSTDSALSIYKKFGKVIEILFGTFFGVLGGKLLFDGLKEIRQ